MYLRTLLLYLFLFLLFFFRFCFFNEARSVIQFAFVRSRTSYKLQPFNEGSQLFIRFLFEFCFECLQL